MELTSNGKVEANVARLKRQLTSGRSKQVANRTDKPFWLLIQQILGGEPAVNVNESLAVQSVTDTILHL